MAAIQTTLCFIHPEAFAQWTTSTTRATEECVHLAELAASFTAEQLHDLHKELASSTSLPITNKDNVFLALTMALLNGQHAASAAAVALSALRCPGAAAHNLFHPLLFLELTKVLRLLLAPTPGRKKTENITRRVVDMEFVDEMTFAAAPCGSAALLVTELTLLLERVPLATYPELLAQLIALLAAVGAYGPLRRCCTPQHGDPQVTIPAVLRAILPALSLTRADTSDALCGFEGFISSVVSDAVDTCACDATQETGQCAGVALQAVQALLQRASVSTPDRAEPRSQVCTTIGRLLIKLPSPTSACYAGFLWRFSRTAKIGHRAFSVEMAASTLSASLMQADGRSARQILEDGTAQTLWRLLLQRLATDKTPAVRSKALSCLAPVLQVMNDEAPARELLALVQAPLLIAQPTCAAGVVTASSSQPAGTMVATLAPSAKLGPDATPSLVRAAPAFLSPSASLLAAVSEVDATMVALGRTLHARIVDNKPSVRRSALAAMEAWIKTARVPPAASLLGAVGSRCKDASPAIRKQATRILNALLDVEPESTVVRTVWLSAVLPLLRDSEASVSDTALDAMCDHILQPLVRCSTKPERGFESTSWGLLTRLTPEFEPLLQYGVRALSKQKRVPASLAATAQAMLTPVAEVGIEGDGPFKDSAGRVALWTILLELSKQTKTTPAKTHHDVGALSECWYAAFAKLTSGCHNMETTEEMLAGATLGVAASDGVFALTGLTDLASRRPPAAMAKAVGESVQTVLFQLDAPSCLLVPLVQAAAALLPFSSAETSWATRLMRACEKELNLPLLEYTADSVRHAAHPALAKRIATLVVTGALTILYPMLLTTRLTSVVQEIALDSAATRAFGGVVTEGAEAHSGKMEIALGALAATAFVTLGKYCLRSVELMKRFLPVFVRELSSHRAVAVRNNVLVVMHDLAKVHTSWLDRHVPIMARALGDVSPLVRQHAMLLLSRLLLQDYVKWKPPLLRAFAIVLVDRERSLRNVAHGCLFDLLLPRTPLMGISHFLPLLFSLNGCVHAPHHSKSLPAAEKVVCELAGEKQQRRRLAILRSFLAQMDDEHKLQITGKLCIDVLAAVPDGHLHLNDASQVVGDALILLVCKEIKLSGGAGDTDADDDEDDTVDHKGKDRGAAAKAKVLSAVARKAMVESIVPIVIELKRYLESARSPLLKDVYLFMRELLRDHKAHLQDIFARDKQLGNEIEYDMRQFANQAVARVPLSLSPLVRTASSDMAPHVPGTVTPTPRGLPKRAMENMAVPTSDRLTVFSVPKLRSGGSGRGSASRSRDLPSSSNAAIGKTQMAIREDSEGGKTSSMPPPESSWTYRGRQGKAGTPGKITAAGKSVRRSHRSADANEVDVVMPSPLKEVAPAKHWLVCPPPRMAMCTDATGLFEDC